MKNQTLFELDGISTSDEFAELKGRAAEEDQDTTSSVVPPPDIVAFNEQRSCADIYRMYEKKQIDINPDFQRGEVWQNRAQTLFIDSLIKQLPIPSMCISLDIKTQKRLVIDGLQRITSIIKFLDTDKDWKLSKTDDVDSRISGKKVSEIKKENNSLFEVLENVTIPITVIRCDYNNKEHMKYLFQIFYRLNSGGNKLYNQEIRNCIFQGNLNSLLKRLARTPSWYAFANVTEDKVNKARFNNEERILRFFAFYNKHSEYAGKLAAFLNDYMEENKDLPEEQIVNFEELFNDTLNIANKLSNKPDSKNIAEAVLVGIAINKDKLSNITSEGLSQIYSALMTQPEFSEEALREGLGAEDKVKDRINKSIELFGRD
ncbi:DUF262 domain-containing protein [Bacteroides ihuae]|uniref:DUF262 domain-containing protein n=1 Tax=Bacteroides ihuae TaxID=1852362 RepID=UPI00098EE5EE|nr:DUF262 domain-containing protein [Bacteroides ihuae]